MAAFDTTNYRHISCRQPAIPADYQPTTMELTTLLIRERRAPNPRQTAALYIARLGLTDLSDLHTAITRLEDFYKSLGQPAARAILGDLPPGVLADVGVTYLALGRGLTNCSAAEYLQL